MNDPIIDALRAEQQRVMVEFFGRPPKKEDIAYEYGLAVGTNRGLELAIQRVLALYRDDQRDDFDSYNLDE